MLHLRPRWIDAAALVALPFAIFGIEGPVLACEQHAYVRVVLDPLPEALRGMRVEVHKTMGTQVVIANPTRRTVEVLDAGGAPFVRIGPAGVEGNIAARAWYETYSPGAVAPASAGGGAQPHWKLAASEPSFGWFEPRLEAKQVPLPMEIIVRGESTDLASWQVSLRVDGEATALTGVFRYDPPPKGTFIAWMTTPSQVAPDVQVRLLPGQVGGFLVQNSGDTALQVVGMDGEPFLRIGPQGVDANLRSRTWWTSARATGRRPAAVESRESLPDWQRVAAAPRFSWIDPRLQVRQGNPPRGSFSWRIPMQIDGERLAVAGETAWVDRPIGEHR
jgi:hypothetical protein